MEEVLPTFRDMLAFALGNHDIYGKKLVKIPTPQYVVFYNGPDPLPEKSLLKLSSAFINPREDGQFEWTATVYNINYGHNQKLLDACVPLKGYSILISKYRTYSNYLSPANAMRKAVDECIDNNISTDVLKEQRTSQNHISCVKKLLLYGWKVKDF